MGRYYHPKRHLVLAAILNGQSIKEASLTHGASINYGSRVCREEGLDKHYITPQEFAMVQEHRRKLTVLPNVVA